MARVLCQENPVDGITVDNFRPISFLPLMWKLTSGMLADNIHDYLEGEMMLPEEKKEYRS